MIAIDLEDRSVLVTGASGGIGAAAARALAAAGATVFGLDLEPGPGERARFIRADVTKAEEVTSAVERVVAETGRLDAVVAAAGIIRDRVLWKMPLEDWRQVLAVNLDGSFHVLRSAAPALRARGGGSIVLVASINGERGKFGQANYAASKAGVIGLAKTAARELGAFGIRVNAVSPGYIDTAMTRGLPEDATRAAVEGSCLGRIGSPDEVASAILFLCSDLSAFVTGQVLRVDGGLYT